MANYRIINGTKFDVPSTASDEIMHIFFHVLVPTDAVPLADDEDVSAASLRHSRALAFVPRVANIGEVATHY
ncbi:MAG: hypothetical protein M1272_01620 [Firmicutes bacterium]|nr:hypothetical protein [Bacillota bacterium]